MSGGGGYQNSQYNGYSQAYQQGYIAAQALRSSLQNPYSSSGYQTPVSSHYAQAYQTQQVGFPSANVHGEQDQVNYYGQYPSSSSLGASTSRQRPSPQNHGSWYEPGNHNCTYDQCQFTGSKKSVQIHMMDRHLIYPPGWEKRKRKRDWDADPSLDNGKSIPIQGTGIVLDTPEAIDAWIEERRKRWPTVTRVQDKEKRLQDAYNRGELNATLDRSKRLRNDGNRGGRNQRNNIQKGQRQNATHERERPAREPIPLPPRPSLVLTKGGSSSGESSDSDIDLDRDAISSKIPTKAISVDEKDGMDEPKQLDEIENPNTREPSVPILPTPVFKRSALKPREPPKGLMTSRPSLLHNLLLPEIRMTVSHLSQAIRFLVNNNFLEGVELKPGDAENRPIKIISSSEHSGPPDSRREQA